MSTRAASGSTVDRPCADCLDQSVADREPTWRLSIASAVTFILAPSLGWLSAASMPIFLASTVVSGVAVGAVFMGSLATANRVAPAEIRRQVISAFFVFAYVGLTIPVIAVGFGSQAFGDFRAILGCAIALAAIALASMAVIRRTAAAVRIGDWDVDPGHCPRH
jgi:MFS family permease